MRKNYIQWKKLHYVWDSVDHFKQDWNRLPGVHTIFFEAKQSPIDIYVNDYVASDKPTVQPIFFTGAISQRNDKKGPFFSGLGITNGLKLPMIAIADPSLDDDTSLSLAWYTGGPDDNFVANLAKLLKAVQETLEREMLLIGGSGGGFAALNVGRHFDGEYSILVWNPQTDIYEYSERFTKVFLKSRFNFAHATLAGSDWKAFCKIRTDPKISTNVLSEDTIKKARRVVYLQNAGDWHRLKHLQPLWAMASNVPPTEGTNVIDQDHVVFIKEFAEGHAPPSAKLIGSLISQMMRRSATAADLDFNAV